LSSRRWSLHRWHTRSRRGCSCVRRGWRRLGAGSGLGKRSSIRGRISSLVGRRGGDGEVCSLRVRGGGSGAGSTAQRQSRITTTCFAVTFGGASAIERASFALVFCAGYRDQKLHSPLAMSINTVTSARHKSISSSRVGDRPGPRGSRSSEASFGRPVCPMWRGLPTGWSRRPSVLLAVVRLMSSWDFKAR
jgi:hypothetical protein